MKQSRTYPSIDMVRTGIRLKKHMEHAGMTVKDIQKALQLSCPQPIYRWFRGKILPTVDHLLMLSELFGVHMEDLLVKNQDKIVPVLYRYDYSSPKRIIMYFEMIAILKQQKAF